MFDEVPTISRSVESWAVVPWIFSEDEELLDEVAEAFKDGNDAEG
jgi:hypothetical protein